MRYVRVSARAPGRTAAEIYPVISDFARYPELTDAVRSVDIEDLGSGRTGCSWEVTFRRGILKWTEEDHYDPENHRVDFSLVTGDLDHLVGHWWMRDEGPDCRIDFACDFDMGIPTLADVIEPIAAQTLGEYITVILRALVGEIVMIENEPEDTHEPQETHEPSAVGAPAGGARRRPV
ncbi:type II toxin-antitoxin system RatA family toxin [Streptomyces niveus]|uniref:type II toxin-antitoxin system RatA family toxin n=1 Tax=Streptomyces niveus TaxID=193462 RepID=UPI00365DF936